MESAARIMIDSKEGIIEIEGPINFVEKYMALYAPGAKTAVIPAEKAAVKRRSSKKECLKTIKAIIKDGYFNQERGFGEIKAAFGARNIECSDPSLRNALKEALSKKKLVVHGAGRGTTYAEPPSSAPQPVPSAAETESMEIPVGVI